MNAAFNLAALPPTTTAAFTPGFPLGANVVWAGPIQMGLESMAQGLFAITTTKEPSLKQKDWVLLSVGYTYIVQWCTVGCSGRCTSTSTKAGRASQDRSNSPIDDEGLTTSTLHIYEEP